MPFAKRGDVVHSEATSGFNNQKKSLLINGLAALGDSHHPLQLSSRTLHLRARANLWTEEQAPPQRRRGAIARQAMNCPSRLSGPGRS